MGRVFQGECFKESATKLGRIQKAGMRMILNIHQGDFPSAVKRCKLGWMYLSCQRSMFRAKCTREYIVNKVPSYMAKQFKTHEELGLQFTRRTSDIYLPTPKSNWLAKSYFYKAGQDWNSLPLEIRTTGDQVFRRRIMTFLWN